MTNQDVVIDQEVPFSHQHHVGDIGIDCRYCHQTVETSARAGVPSTQVCMNCHRELWNQADMLEPVRVSFRENRPLHWNRVYDLPDYVYFNHSIHVKKGVGCFECHGRVGEMPLMRRASPLTMQWCLDCHRNPVQHLRPHEFVFEPLSLEEILSRRGSREDSRLAKDPKRLTSSAVGADVNQIRNEVAMQNHVHGKTDCYTCHR